MSNTLKKSIHLVIALICSIALFLAGAFIVPKPIAIKADVPSEFTNISFRNFGIADGSYTYDSNASYVASGQLGEELDMKYFSGYVKFTGAPRLYIGGSADGKGLRISTMSNGAALTAYWGSTRIVNLVTGKAGITFKNTEFLLGVTFKKVDADSDSSKDDLELTFWFNGNAYDNGAKFYAYNVGSDFGDFVSVECPSSSAGLEIRNDSNAGAIPDKSLNQLSTQHFYIDDGTYGYSDGAVAVSGTYLLSTSNSHFNANVKFSAVEGAAIHYAAKEKDGGLGGFVFMLQGGNLVLTENLSGNNLSVTFTAADAGLTSFTDTFKLGISIKAVNKDEGSKANDLEIGIWFNDVLYKNEYIYLLDQLNNLGNSLGLYSPVQDSTVTVGVISGMEITMPDPTLERLTFDQFNITDGEYSSSGDIAVFGDSNNSIANTYFSGKIKFNGGTHFIYGNANGAKWSGTLRIYPVDATTFAVVNHNAKQQLALIPVSQTPLNSTYDEFRLGISTEVIDNDGDGQKDDVKIGFYFNEDLCDTGFIYQNDYVQYIGTGMSFYTPTGASVKVGTVREFLPPSQAFPAGLREISIDSFSIEDGTYKYRNNDLSFNKGYAKKSIQDTYLVFNTKITKTDDTKELSFRYGGGGWGGIQITVFSDKIRLHHTSNPAATTIYLTAENSGVDSFTGVTYKMGFTTQFVDVDGDGQKDDVRFGVWVDDVLCGNKYFELIDYAGKLGKNLALYVAGTTDTVELESIEVPPYVIPDDQRHKMPEDLTKITLNDFTINDCVATYRNNDLYLNKKYDKSLDNTYCEFYVTPSSTTKETSIRYGGGGWGGLSIKFDGKRLAVHPTSDETKKFTLFASDSKMTSFADQTYLLGISTQYMDLDNDGEIDDVRFGIWANGVLCGNEYIDLVNYVEKMGKSFAVYIAEEGATLGLKSIMIPIDFELFGFTVNWATELNIFASGTTSGSSAGSSSTTQSPQTGDTMVRPMLFSCVALGGLMDTDKTHRRKLNVR